MNRLWSTCVYVCVYRYSSRFSSLFQPIVLIFMFCVCVCVNVCVDHPYLISWNWKHNFFYFLWKKILAYLDHHLYKVSLSHHIYVSVLNIRLLSLIIIIIDWFYSEKQFYKVKLKTTFSKKNDACFDTKSAANVQVNITISCKTKQNKKIVKW